MKRVLSIITINRNNAVGLQRTMESVYTQRYTDVEYIVIDGASTDDSVSVIQSYAAKEVKPALKWLSEPDTGIYKAMNKGLGLATGEYCLFLNSGDCLSETGVLEKVVPLLGSVDVYYGDAVFSQEKNTLERMYPNKLTMDFFYNDSLCHQAIFYRRELLQLLGGYDEAYRLIADWVLNVKLFRGKYSFEHIPVQVAYYDTEGMTGGNIGYEKCRQERERYYKTNRLWYIHQWMWIKRKINQILHCIR